MNSSIRHARSLPVGFGDDAGEIFNRPVAVGEACKLQLVVNIGSVEDKNHIQLFSLAFNSVSYVADILDPEHVPNGYSAVL
ncbi:hypothetical protein MMC29_003967 [Sticta canariensis]|nr:hypothetical protein [Sticta canariensis]